MLFFLKKKDFVMKKIKVLSLLMLLASTKIDSMASNNPELSLVLAYQALDNFARTVSSDRDDVGALQLLDFMNNSIAFDAQQKQQIAAAKDGYLSKGTPLDPVKIAQQNKDLAARLEVLDHNIKEFKKGGVTAKENKKVDNRRQERKHAEILIKKNTAALAVQNAALADAEQKAQAAQALIEQNELAFEQALEAYISSFGQVYANNGSIVISSKYNQNMSITPKEYAQFMATLKNGANQFGSSILITLDLDNAPAASIKDVASYVGNMAPSGASWASYAKYALAATALTAAAIGAAVVYSNYSQGKDWNDTGDAQAAYNAGLSKAKSGYNVLATSAATGYESASKSAYSMLGDAVNYMQSKYDQYNGKIPAQAASDVVNDIASTTPEVVADLAQAAADESGKPQDQQMAHEIVGKLEDGVELDAQESNWLMKAGVALGAVGTVAVGSKIPAVRNALRNAQFMPSSASQSIASAQSSAATQASMANRQAQQLAAMSPRGYAQTGAGKTSASQTIDYAALNANLDKALYNTMNPNTGMSAAQAAQQASRQSMALSAANVGVAGAVAAGANAVANGNTPSMPSNNVSYAAQYNS
jgi:trimeric autotransporter adhesin